MAQTFFFRSVPVQSEGNGSSLGHDASTPITPSTFSIEELMGEQRRTLAFVYVVVAENEEEARRALLAFLNPPDTENQEELLAHELLTAEKLAAYAGSSVFSVDIG